MLLPPPPALPEACHLFLDFDGTLVELAPRHDAIEVPDALKALLPRLDRALDGRVAIVTGRPAEEIVRYLTLDPARPGLLIAGSHGAETIRPDGHREATAPPAALDRALAAMEAFADQDARLLVERKPVGCVIHYRQAADREADCIAEVERIARETGFEALAGKMIVELRPPGIDKGGAMRRLIAPGAVPVFVGDDRTDEAGFAAAAALGGWGVLVGEREDSAAAWALPDVDAVLGWLAAAV